SALRMAVGSHNSGAPCGSSTSTSSARSPEAKGRVERANGTLQDRLVKELRLRGLHDPVAAAPFLPEFMADYNRRFAKPPAGLRRASPAAPRRRPHPALHPAGDASHQSPA